jgi:translation initiation factor 1
MVCSKCGLPEELCICEIIAKEAQKIRVSVVPVKKRKFVTVIKGIDSQKIDIKELLKILKTKLACGGTFKNDGIELQGNHKERIKQLLVKEGFSQETIEVQ